MVLFAEHCIVGNGDVTQIRVLRTIDKDGVFQVNIGSDDRWFVFTSQLWEQLPIISSLFRCGVGQRGPEIGCEIKPRPILVSALASKTWVKAFNFGSRPVIHLQKVTIGIADCCA